MISVKKYTYTIILITIFTSILFHTCKKEQQVRKLKEKPTTIAPAAKEDTAEEHQKKTFRWEKPHHWQTKESKGLRLATFSANDQIVCTLIPLSKDGGGLEANIQRWLAQLGLQLKPQELKSFMENRTDFKTKTNLSATFLDFSPLLKDDTAPSMMVTVISVPQITLFVKMSGPRALLKKQYDPFILFSKSISLSQ